MANEKRLISLDEALKATHGEIYWTESQQAAVRSFLVKQPKVDAVEVVRCKDCKHRGDDAHCSMCFEEAIEWDDDGYTEVDYVLHDRTTDDGFCDRGERREGE